MSRERGVLPDFLVIGAQKCGTTTLYDYLTQHPDVLPAAAKELQYFTAHHDRGVDWYRSQFPAPGRFKNRTWLTGEATPFYVFHPSVPARVAAVVPDVRLILSVRDPASRAHSQYKHSTALGFETLPFDAALAAEEDRLAAADVDDQSFRVHSYVARGRYDEQLRRWLDYFPRDQFHFIEAEDLFEQPERVAGETFRFLGLAPDVPVQTRHLNFRGPRIEDDAIIRRLREQLRPSVRRFADLAGRSFRWSG